MTRPRALVVSATPMDGDWASSALLRALFGEWDESELQVLTIERLDGSPGDDVRAIPHHRLRLAGSRSPRSLLRNWRAALRVAEEFAPEVIYLRSAGWPVALEYIAARVARKRRIPFIVHVMDDWPKLMSRRGWMRARVGDMLMSHLMSRATVRLGISAKMAAAYKRRYGQPMTVVHGGADLAEWTTTWADFGLDETELSPEKELRYSGGVATSQSKRALADVAASVRRLRDHGTPVRLVLSVPIALVAEVKEQFETDGVTVEGFQPRPIYLRALSRADALLIANNFDGDTIALLELSMANKIGDYLASATPIIVYGPKEIATVADAVNGGWAEVVTSPDGSHLDRSLIRVLFDSDRRQALRAPATTALTLDFNIAIQRHRFEEAVQRAIG